MHCVVLVGWASVLPVCLFVAVGGGRLIPAQGVRSAMFFSIRSGVIRCICSRLGFVLWRRSMLPLRRLPRTRH